MNTPTATGVFEELPLVEYVAPVNHYQRSILAALPRMGKHIYQGTVAPAEKAKRRAAGRAQRAARRATRRAA